MNQNGYENGNRFGRNDGNEGRFNRDGRDYGRENGRNENYQYQNGNGNGPYSGSGSSTPNRFKNDPNSPYINTQWKGDGSGHDSQSNVSMPYGGPNETFSHPPQAPQSFGVDGYHFQYSNCSGRRKALLVGVNYFNTKQQLKGCINDVKNIQKFLLRSGYKEEDMVVLTDDQEARSQPTRANMLRGMQWLVKDAQTNDTLFFHYSGHGGRTPDLDGDEDSGYDDVIYPVDFQTNGHIVDDLIHETMVRPLQPGVRLTALFDCCNSGTAMDLPYVYSTKGILKEPNLAKEAGLGLLSAYMLYTQGDVAGVVSSVTNVINRVRHGNHGYEKKKQTKTSPSDVIMFSGCKDDQTSADTFADGQATGAMSHAFIEVMNKNSNQSYLTLLQNMRGLLEGKYTQKPQLSSSHPIDTNLKFIF